MNLPEDIAGGTDIAFWLTRSVGRTLGLSFTRAMEDGRLDPSEFADLITTCRNCPHAGACQQWLGQAGGPRGASRAPAFCPNGDALHALKPH
ncbi:MAG: DUF6455 family protein [Acidobacteriota bacterium]